MFPDQRQRRGDRGGRAVQQAVGVSLHQVRRRDGDGVQFLLRSSHPPQPDVQEGGGRPVQVQAQQRADDVPHEGKRLETSGEL